MTAHQNIQVEIARFLNQGDKKLQYIATLTKRHNDKPNFVINEILKISTKDRYSFTAEDLKSTIKEHLGCRDGVSPRNNYCNDVILKAMEHMDEVFLRNLRTMDDSQ